MPRFCVRAPRVDKTVPAMVYRALDRLRIAGASASRQRLETDHHVLIANRMRRTAPRYPPASGNLVARSEPRDDLDDFVRVRVTSLTSELRTPAQLGWRADVLDSLRASVQHRLRDRTQHWKRPRRGFGLHQIADLRSMEGRRGIACANDLPATERDSLFGCGRRGSRRYWCRQAANVFGCRWPLVAGRASAAGARSLPFGCDEVLTDVSLDDSIFVRGLDGRVFFSIDRGISLRPEFDPTISVSQSADWFRAARPAQLESDQQMNPLLHL